MLTRADKGSPLTHAEMDNNFIELQAAGISNATWQDKKNVRTLGVIYTAIEDMIVNVSSWSSGVNKALYLKVNGNIIQNSQTASSTLTTFVYSYINKGATYEIVWNDNGGTIDKWQEFRK